MKELENYNKAKEELSSYFGMNYPILYDIDDNSDKSWVLDGSEVTTYDTLQAYQEEDDNHTYGYEIYGSCVYVGAEYTGIVVNDGCGERFFMVLDNSKKQERN